MKKESTPSYNMKKESTPSYNMKKESTPSYNMKKENTPSYNMKKESTPSYNMKKDNKLPLSEEKGIPSSETTEKFQEAVYQYALEKSQNIRREVSEYKSKRLREEKIKIAHEIKVNMEKELEKAQSRHARDMAKKEQELRKEVLLERKRIMQSVFAAAKRKLLDFAKLPEFAGAYEACLISYAKEAAPVFTANDTAICMHPEDNAFQAAIAQAFAKPCVFEADTTIEIGGIRIKSAELGLIADLSIDAMLADQTDWFETYSGLTVI